MRPTLTLNCVLAMGLFTCIGAITVSIDRSDNKPPPTRSSMIANGWRPLTNGYEETIGTNVSPASSLERNGPLHPVLGKLQEHMTASEKLKPQRKNKPPGHHDYSPPSILGSFTVFGHAGTKPRGEPPTHNHLNKHLGSETREYTFLIPPPKDAYRFDLDPHRKPILRDNSAYQRQPQFNAPYQQPDPIKAATYFIKGYTSTTNSPSSTPTKNRHFAEVPYIPPLLQPPRYQQSKPFESQKVPNNMKLYFQPPGAAAANDFGKDKRLSEHDHRGSYDKYPGQVHNEHIISPASTGNFFSQVNHPPQPYKTSYERDPAFLVHESHEISYITPPNEYNGYNFRPSLPYETLLPPDVYASSTPAPTTPRTQESNKYQSGEQDYQRPGHSTIQQAENGPREALPTSGMANTYYVSEHQDLTPPPASWPAPKNKYPSDINEVLPRVNPPSKFHEEVIGSNQLPQVPKVFFVGAQATPPRYHTSVQPIDIRPETPQPEYETPESISLKHFNEQQYLLQQQLLQRDRQRLAEQERQQQLEIEQQQQEELKKRQQELRELLQQQKEDEEARLAVESARNQSNLLAKVNEQQSTYNLQLPDYEIPKVTTDNAPAITEYTHLGDLPKIQQSQVAQPDYVISESPIGEGQRYQQSKNQPEGYREGQSDSRGQRPAHKLSRDQYRRRKPATTTMSYEPAATEAPVQLPETVVPVTLRIEEVPLQTTPPPPELGTVPTATTQKPRTRRPGAPLRRRRPTTTTPEPITVADEFFKYDKPEDTVQQQLDASRRRRVKPTQSTYEESVTEKKANIRKRPGHRNRVNPGEPFEAEIVTEIVHTGLNTYKPSAESLPGYNDYNQQYATSSQPSDPFATSQPASQYVTSQPANQFTSQAIGQHYDHPFQNYGSVDEQRETVTETVPLDYLTDVTRTKIEDAPNNENYNAQDAVAVTNIPLEDLFAKTDGNYFDKSTAVSTSTSVGSSSSSYAPTAAPMTTTTTVPSTTQSSAPATPSRTHKIRPGMRYGNTTRPRFSIKDYKSRMEYKSRLATVSTTEASVTPVANTRQRGSSYKSQNQAQQQQQLQSSVDSNRETTGRYKYVSRVNYRTTSPSPARAQEQEIVAEDGPSTTERTRFVPKRRPVSGNVYRSRISGTTSSPKYESEAQSKPSTARPENVFSSSVRRRPVMKSRLSSHRETSTAAYADRKTVEATEMAAEETSFYSAVTTVGSTRVAANEIPVEKEEAGQPSSSVKSEDGEGADRNADESETGSSFHAQHENPPVEPVPSSTAKNAEESQLKETAAAVELTTAKTEQPTDNGDNNREQNKTSTIDEEELFAKASLSVADLTSSASALYDKPGMFKAVSPDTRIAASHFKIPSDEPTLPIEAFFQELSKKS